MNILARTQGQELRRIHGYSIDLIVKIIVKNKMTLSCSKNEKFFFSDISIRIIIENEIYCYINGFLKWNISRKTSYIVGNKKYMKDLHS